ncbi:MAG: diguanylate cyclase [Thermodesulfobacteriota bacterium]
MIIGVHEMYVGETAEIAAIRGEQGGVRRLKGMGLREGKLIDLLHYDPLVNKKIVINCDNIHLAFDASLSEGIRVRPLKGYFAEIKSMAHHDQLTGCLKRHAANRVLAHEYEKFADREIPMSLLLADIDHFKKINDTRGHGAGDEVLKDLAAVMRSALRRSDTLCRWGGEEFLVLLRGTEPQEAFRIGERVRRMVESHVFSPFAVQGLVTVSVGGSGLPPARPLAQLVETADAALYAAKNNGRNQVKIC